MASIDGVGGPGGARGVLRPNRPAGAARNAAAFALPDATAPGGAAGAAATAATAAAAAAAGVDALLLLQEMPDPALRDRAARRRAQDLLQALAALQHALLGASGGEGGGEYGGGGAAALAQLEALLCDLPVAADPALAALAEAVALRARIELARRGR